MNYEYEPILKGKSITIKTLNGIGDLCWCAVKLANLKKVYEIPKLTIKMHMAGDHRDTRSHDFIKNFDFVDFVIFSKFDIHKNPVNYKNRINYVDNGYDEYKKEYTFIINPYIEWKGRLENIFPDVPPCYDFFNKCYISNKSDLNFAKNLQRIGFINNQKRVGSICFHLGCTSNNTHNGMNRFEKWKIEDWAELTKKIRLITDLPIYIIGAKYDDDYASRLIDQTKNQNLNILNLCGKTTTTQTIEILKNTSLVVSFASGIGISSTYLETPTIMFWMPEGESISPYHFLHFSNSFATNWVPPYLINKTYFPAYYFKDDVDSVFSYCYKALENAKYRFS